jgi:hypothetical protein
LLRATNKLAILGVLRRYLHTLWSEAPPQQQFPQPIQSDEMVVNSYA